jgi:WD40 repeat protein
VTGICWSGDSRHFATSSVDNTVILWKAFDPLPASARRRPADPPAPFGVHHDRAYSQGAGPLRTLRGHSGWVTGLTWCPTGDLIASQEQEGTVIVWKSDGTPVAKLSPEVFFNAAGGAGAAEENKGDGASRQPQVTRPKPTGSMLRFSLTRLSFSCDGNFLVVCGLFNNVFVSGLFSRADWALVTTYVGPSQSTTCAAFSNHLFIDKSVLEQRKQQAAARSAGAPAPKEDQAAGLFTLLAIGVRFNRYHHAHRFQPALIFLSHLRPSFFLGTLQANDSSVSLARSDRARPLIVFSDIFDTTVLDLCWSKNGRCLLASSAGGEVAVVRLSSGDINALPVTGIELIKNVLRVHGPRVRSPPCPLSLISRPFASLI